MDITCNIDRVGRNTLLTLFFAGMFISGGAEFLTLLM
jgi:hypothetical protein